MGGTWTVQNKTRSGSYTNFKSVPRETATLGERGITTFALSLSWGVSSTPIEIEAGQDTSTVLGYSILDPQLLLVKEALKKAQKVVLYRLNTGTKATVTVEDLVVTAKYGGVRGNDLSIVISENVDDDTKFDVSTLLDGAEMDLQVVSGISDLVDNDWVVFSGTGDMAVTAGAPLTSGADGTVNAGNHTSYMSAMETIEFNTMAYIGTDDTLKGAYISYVNRLRDTEGNKVQVVMENYPSADYEGVISVKNGVILADGTTLSAAQACAWVAGASAGADVNESLSAKAYDGAIDANPRYTNSQIIAALQAGEFLFTFRNGKAIVEQDINTFTSFAPTKGKEYSKNRALRVLDEIGNSIDDMNVEKYIGQADNNADGRNIWKKDVIKLMNNLQAIGAIQNFDATTDIIVNQGDDIDSVVSELYVQPVDAIEKIYMTVYSTV